MKNNKFFKKTLEKGRFNLFDLISIENSPNSWLWCAFNSEILKKAYLKKLRQENQKEIVLRLSTKLNCGKSTLEKHLIRLKKSKKECKLPLIIIEVLCDYINPRLKNVINKFLNKLYFTNRLSKPVKAVHSLSEGLTDIIGAFVSDGNLYKNPKENRINISEGNKNSLILVGNKINKIFKYNPRLTFSEKDHTWRLWVSNKVICRYFENIFGFKPGKKSDIVSMPKIIKDANFSIKRAFVRGIFTFDGCVKTTGNIAFCTRSKTLMNDIESVLQKDNIQYKINYNKNKDAWNLESNSGRNSKSLNKWEKYFIKGSDKYRKLHFFLGKLKITSLSELENLFPTHYSARINFSKIYATIKYIKKGEIVDILNYLNNKKIKIAKTSLYKYLYLLSASSLIAKENYQVKTNKNGFFRTIYSIK